MHGLSGGGSRHWSASDSRANSALSRGCGLAGGIDDHLIPAVIEPTNSFASGADGDECAGSADGERFFGIRNRAGGLEIRKLGSGIRSIVPFGLHNGSHDREPMLLFNAFALVDDMCHTPGTPHGERRYRRKR